jgi:hypothetical protein
VRATCARVTRRDKKRPVRPIVCCCRSCARALIALAAPMGSYATTTRAASTKLSLRAWGWPSVGHGPRSTAEQREGGVAQAPKAQKALARRQTAGAWRDGEMARPRCLPFPRPSPPGTHRRTVPEPYSAVLCCIASRSSPCCILLPAFYVRTDRSQRSAG